MIAFLRGKLAEALPTQVVVDVNGVGYHLFVPLSTFDRLGELGADVHLLTHFHVRENDQALYGFATTDERDLFRLLIGRVSGVGPKVALGVLSGMSVDEFKSAVVAEDIAAISRIKGLGKKTTERIVLELKDKVGVTEAWSTAAAEAASGTPALAGKSDAVAGLIALGYKQAEATKAVDSVIKSGVVEANGESSDLLREALRHLQ